MSLLAVEEVALEYRQADARGRRVWIDTMVPPRQREQVLRLTKDQLEPVYSYSAPIPASCARLLESWPCFSKDGRKPAQ
jgi:hypothetical protein